MARILSKSDEHAGPPRIKCPHCSKIINMSLEAWKDNVTNIIEDKCYHCGGSIIVGLLILGDKDPKRFSGLIQSIIQLVQSKSENIITN